MKDLERIFCEEKNENTALILVLNEFNSKLTEIRSLITDLNKLSTDILSCLQTAKNDIKQEYKPYILIEKEDYVD